MWYQRLCAGGPKDNNISAFNFLGLVLAGYEIIQLIMLIIIAQLRTPTWKLLLVRQALHPSWQHLTRLSSMLDSHHRVNSSPLWWSPTAQSAGMLFSSWASWAAGDWWRRPGMFEHLRFYSNGFPLWCNVSVRFCCMMVSLTTTGQSKVHYQKIL